MWDSSAYYNTWNTVFKNMETFIGNTLERIYEYPRTQYLTVNLLQLKFSEDLQFIHKSWCYCRIVFLFSFIIYVAVMADVDSAFTF